MSRVLSGLIAIRHLESVRTQHAEHNDKSIIIIIIITLGVFNASAIRLPNDLGRRISSISGDIRETSHLYQRVSMLVQRFNAVLLHDSLPVPDCTD